MSTGNTTERATFTTTWKLLGKVVCGAVLGAGLLLGGCNNKLQEDHDALVKENSELREKYTQAETSKQQAEARAQQLQSQTTDLQAQVAAARMQQPQPAIVDNFNPDRNVGSPVRGLDRSSQIVISSDVLFGAGSATLKPDARRELDKYLGRFKSASSITIEGHTDSDPIKKSKWESNKALSKARADAVRDYLASKGVSRSKIETVGKGASEPKGSKKESRRVDIVVVE